jgi:deoxyribonuclease-4
MYIGVSIEGSEASFKSLLPTTTVVQTMFQRPPTVQTVLAIRDEVARRDLSLCIHAPYTLNIAKLSSIKILKGQIELAERLGAKFVVVHCGRASEPSAKEEFINNLKSVETGNMCILVENPAGQKNEMLSDLSDFFSAVRMIGSDNIKACVDTCHAFAAGYTMEELVSYMNANKDIIRLIHLNDSARERGSRVDRHAPVGKGFAFSGKAGASCLEKIIEFASSSNILTIFETPDTPESTLLNGALADAVSALAKGEKNVFKRAAFRRAAVEIRKFQKKILTAEDAKEVPGVGKGIAERIERILKVGIPSETGYPRITRETIEGFADYFKSMLNRLDSSIKFEVVGSYRRGAKTSGDIDILISWPPFALKRIVAEMESDGAIKKVLAAGKSKAMLVVTGGIRVDLLAAPKESYAASLLYFTGSRDFNIRMRRHAKSLGMKLNEHGLFISTHYQMSGAEERQIDTPTEKSIFNALGLAYASPRQRF